jgi:hypothetical protein
LGYITSCFDMVIYFNLENQICNFCLQLRVWSSWEICKWRKNY